jgi:hypothetical protein
MPAVLRTTCGRTWACRPKELTALMRRNFPTLAARNVKDMK